MTLRAEALALLLPDLAEDLAGYEVEPRVPLDASIGGALVLTMPAPSRGGAVVQAGLEVLDGRGDDVSGSISEARSLAAALAAGYAAAPPGSSSGSRPTGTTNVSVVDGDGTAVALSSTLGSGSGVFRHGFQLNNMLGELDVIGEEPRDAGTRLPSMMAPTLVLADDEPRLVIGSAGSVRLAGAILQVVAGVVRQGLAVEEAISRPRLHVDGETVHIEGGWPDGGRRGARGRRLRPGRLGGRQPLLRRRVRGRAETRGRPGRGGRPAARRLRMHRPVIAIRRAEPADAPDLVALSTAVGKEAGEWLLTTDTWRSTADERRYLRTVRRHPDAAVFVAVDDDRIVARLSVARDPHPASAHVADLGLIVASGDRRRGIGRLLLDTAVTWAHGAGIRKLELHVFPWNTPAIRLYETYGFVREGHRRGHYRRDDADVDALLMAYHLPPAPESPPSRAP